MNLFRPNIYQKNIFEIDYAHLKKLGITCLVFDLDNTLGFIEKKCSQEVLQFVLQLKKDFLVIICSNNTKRRIKPYLDDLGVGGICWSMKPSILGLRRVQKKYHLEKSKMCIIGDQMVTDIVAGNRFHILTVLVDPMSNKDLKITEVIRYFESLIIRNYQKKGIFERGKYYE